MLFVAALLPLSCTTDSDELPNEESTNPKIEAALCEFFENHSASDTANYFIYYDAAQDEAITVDEETYALGMMIYELGPGRQTTEANEVDVTTIYNSENIHRATRAPSGSGWVYAGRANGLVSAISIGKNVAKKLPQRANVEIYLEYQSDGSYKVYYRKAS